MKKVLRNVLFLSLAFVLMIGLFFVPTIQSVGAEEDFYVNLSYSEEDSQYYVIAECYYEMLDGNDANYYYVFNINGVEMSPFLMDGNASVFLPKGKTTYEVSCKYVSEVGGVQTVLADSQKLVLAATIIEEPQPEETEEPDTIVEVVIYKTLLPIVAIVCLVIISVYIALHGRFGPMPHVIKKLNKMNYEFDEMVKTLQNEKFSEKTKNKKYLRFLIKMHRKVKRCSVTVITLNVDSMGQYNNTLVKLFKFENMLKAYEKTANGSSKKSSQVLRRIKKTILAETLSSAVLVEKAMEKFQKNSSNLYSQHAKIGDDLQTKEDYQNFLDNAYAKSGEDEDEFE